MARIKKKKNGTFCYNNVSWMVVSLQVERDYCSLPGFFTVIFFFCLSVSVSVSLTLSLSFSLSRKMFDCLRLPPSLSRECWNLSPSAFWKKC